MRKRQLKGSNGGQITIQDSGLSGVREATAKSCSAPHCAVAGDGEDTRSGHPANGVRARFRRCSPSSGKATFLNRDLTPFDRPPAANPVPPQWDEAQISQGLAPGRFRLADGRMALQAFSCILTPEPGDRVLLLQSASGLYVTSILQREGGAARLCVPGAQLLSVTQPALEVNAASHIALRSLGDVDLTSAQGAVSVSARHFLACASESLVQNAQHLVTNAQHCVMQIAALLRVHGRQTLITADQDMKLDAERISLG